MNNFRACNEYSGREQSEVVRANGCGEGT